MKKQDIKKQQEKIINDLTTEQQEFLEESSKFLKENNIKPKEFTYQTGHAFLSSQKN